MFDAATFDIAGIKFVQERSDSLEYFKGKRHPYALGLRVTRGSVELLAFENWRLVYNHEEYHDVEDALDRLTSSAPSMAGARGQEFHETQEAALGALKAHAEGFFSEVLEGWAEWIAWKQGA